MKRRTIDRIFLSLVLALVLVPVLGGVFCHCAHAEVSSVAAIESRPCQGCCPESMASPDCRAVLTESVQGNREALQSVPFSILYARTESFVPSDFAKDGGSSLEHSPPAFLEALKPLYILNLVLRF